MPYSTARKTCAGITEKVSAGWIATEAKRIDRQIGQCDALLGKLAEAETIARSLRLTSDGEPERSLIDCLNAIEDAATAARGARTELDEELTPRMEEAL